MLCLAHTIALLVLGRILQGLSGAVVWTAGQALLVDTVGQSEIGQSMGWLSLSMSLAVLVAPLLGGVVYEKAGYYAVYFMAFGLIGLEIILRLALVEKRIAQVCGFSTWILRNKMLSRVSALKSHELQEIRKRILEYSERLSLTSGS